MATQLTHGDYRQHTAVKATITVTHFSKTIPFYALLSLRNTDLASLSD